MANLTDPLAAAVHGTDPQSLMEYIVRQRIYDCRFWKEECFGLTAADVLEKAASSLRCVGASFGGNAQPTRFLCLTLKLLQIHPDMDLIEDVYLAQEEFKYVRCLGALYLRLCGKPAQIYQQLEPLYRDYRKVRYRGTTEWKLYYMDEFVHELLTSERVCGIALPRLPSRELLVQEGYLEDEEYPSPLLAVLNEGGLSLEEYLNQKMQQGSEAAKTLWEERQARKRKLLEGEQQTTNLRIKDHGADKQELPQNSRHGPIDPSDSYYGPAGRNLGSPLKEGHQRHSRGINNDHKDYHLQGSHPTKDKSERREAKKQKKDNERKYGSLFKKSRDKTKSSSAAKDGDDKGADENSEEYWNEQRAKLGLKPLK